MRIFIVTVLLTLIAAAFWVLAQHNTSTTAKVAVVAQPKSKPSAEKEKDITAAEKKVTKKLATGTKPSLPASDFYAVNKPSTQAKQILQTAEVLPKDLNNEAYIEFDLDSLRTLEPGQNFELLIPQTQASFIAEVTSISESGNGDKSIFGKVTGVDGRFHTTVLTVGENAVYGQLTVPSGNYVFESKDQYGWIAAKRDLYRSHEEEEMHPPHAKEPSSGVQKDIFNPKSNIN